MQNKGFRFPINKNNKTEENHYDYSEMEIFYE